MEHEGKRLGGAPANFAYHAAQFGHEGLVVSAIGLKMVILTKGINGSVVLWKGGPGLLLPFALAALETSTPASRLSIRRLSVSLRYHES